MANISNLLNYTKENFLPLKKDNTSTTNINVDIFSSLLLSVKNISNLLQNIFEIQKSNRLTFQDINDNLKILKIDNTPQDLPPQNSENSDTNGPTKQNQNKTNSLLERLLLIFERKKYQEEEDRQEKKNSTPFFDRSIPNLPSKGLGGFLTDMLSSIFLGPKGKSLISSLIPASLGVAGLAITKGIAALLLGPKLFESIKAGLEEQDVVGGVGKFIDTFFKETDLDDKLMIGAGAGFLLAGIRGIIPGIMFGGAIGVLQKILGEDATQKTLKGETGMFESLFIGAGFGALLGSKFGIPGILLGAALGSVFGVINNDKFKLNVKSITMSAIGSVGGAVAGMKIGALIGSVGSPVGMIAGALLGGAIGLALGAVLSDQSEAEKAAQEYVDAAKKKRELLDKYGLATGNDAQNVMTSEDFQLLNEYNRNLDMTTEKFRNEGIQDDDISQSINLLTKPEENDDSNITAMTEADNRNYMNLASKILDKTEDPSLTKLSDVLSYDFSTGQSVTKVPMRDKLGNIQPAGTSFSKIDDTSNQTLYETLNKLTYSSDLVQKYDDEGDDENMDKAARAYAQFILDNKIREGKEPDNRPTSIKGHSFNDNMQLRSPGEGKPLDIDNTNNILNNTLNNNTKSSEEKTLLQNNPILKSVVDEINNFTDMNIKNLGEVFTYDINQQDLVFKKDIEIIQNKTAYDKISGGTYTDIQQYRKGQSISTLLPFHNTMNPLGAQRVLFSIADKMALTEGKYDSFYKKRPGVNERRQIISDVIENNILNLPMHKNGAVFTKPQLFIAGESRVNNPEILFNKEQLLALGHVFKMEKENKMMRENTMSPVMIPPATNSNFVDNKQISVQEYNITEIPPEPNSSVSFRDNLLY